MAVLTRTRQRTVLEEELLPAFARRFPPSAFVVNVGAGDHPYREYFSCRYVTADRQPGCDDMYAAERIPYPDASVDGLLFLSVFDRLDDPMQAMRELRRVLKSGGWLLFGAADLGFEWRVARDRWRLSPGGLAHVLRDFEAVEVRNIDRVYHYAVARKP